MAKQPPLTIGLEEELFLVDLASRDLATSWPQEFSLECTSKFPEQIVHEFLNCQIELISKPHETISSLEKEFKSLRAHVIKCAKKYDMGLLAASTHPFATWLKQTTSENKRYSRLEENLQLPARRMLVSGMHIHIGLDSNEQRLNLLNKISQYLPIILALTTSSPFWVGLDSGLSSVRLGVLNGLPRSGLPERFKSYKSYEKYIQTLINAGAIESAREIWWDARLSAHYPTVEIRIADTCTLLRDSMALCALVQCLAHYLLYIDDSRHTTMQEHLLKENRWRAQRYDIATSSLIDMTSLKACQFPQLVNQLLADVASSAQILGNGKYLKQIKNILINGTSADRQRAVFQKAQAGVGKKQALIEVVDSILDETQDLSMMNTKKKLSKAFA